MAKQWPDLWPESRVQRDRETQENWDAASAAAKKAQHELEQISALRVQLAEDLEQGRSKRQKLDNTSPKSPNPNALSTTAKSPPSLPKAPSPKAALPVPKSPPQPAAKSPVSKSPPKSPLPTPKSPPAGTMETLAKGPPVKEPSPVVAPPPKAGVSTPTIIDLEQKTSKPKVGKASEIPKPPVVPKQ